MKLFFIFLSAICMAFSNGFRPTHIYLIGDSTMANKSEKAIPENGWGQVLQYFFGDSVFVDNHAKNGHSTKSFIDEGRWKKVVSDIQRGDYVIIQFGHNDEKTDTVRHTSPFNTYTRNLEKFIAETKEKGATPILCTSIVRRHFNENGTLTDTHGDYLAAVKQVAKENDVYFIDMEAKTRKLVLEMGQEKSKQLFLHLEPGIYPQRPGGLRDNTHLSQQGAFMVAGLAIDGMKELGIPVIKYLKNK